MNDNTLIPRPNTVEAPFDEPDQDAAQPTTGGGLSAYLHAFRRRWFAAISLGLLVGAAAGAAVWSTSKDQYTATVNFRVAATPESLIFDNSQVKSGDYEIYQNTQQQLLRTDYVIKAALRPDAVNQLPIVLEQEDPDRWLAEQITTRFPNEGEVMAVSVSGKTANEAALLTAAVAKAYIDEVVTQETKDRSRRLSEIQNTLREKNAERDTKNAELRELAKTLGSKDSETLSNQQRVDRDRWYDVYHGGIEAQSEVRSLKIQLKIKQDKLTRMQDADGDALLALVSPFELGSAFAMDSHLAYLNRELDDATESLEEGLKRGMPGAVPRHKEKYKGILVDIQEDISLRKDVIEQDLRQHKMAMLSDEVADITGKLDIKTMLVETLLKNEETLRELVFEFSGSSMVVEGLQKGIDDLDKIIDPLDTQARQLEIELRRPNRVTRVTRLESEEQSGNLVSSANLKLEDLVSAIFPKGPNSNSKVQSTAAAGVAVFGLVVAGILFLDLRSQRVNSSTDVSALLGLPVIGAIPLIPARAISGSGSRSHRYRRYRTLLKESMRGVMVRLLHDTPAGESRVVFVSSASSGEGKSTLASNLGVAMARAGYRTLLVDSDLRRPSLHGLFGIPAEPGVGEVLRQEATLDQTINSIETENLSILPAGRWSPNDVAVLANGRTENFFADLRKDFQFVIVDTAPILGVAEAQLLCQHADTVLLSILRDVSSSPDILAACETLANFGVKSLFAVVTGSSNIDSKYYYSDYGLEDDEEAKR